MKHHFFYTRSQRRSAKTLLMNVVVVLLMLFAAHRWGGATEPGRQLLFWVNIVVPIVVAGLLVGAAYLWHKNGAFTIAVDDTQFLIDEPIFQSASFSVPVRDIVEIRQIHHKHSDHNEILMEMKSGEKHEITKNYSYNRGKLYAALAKVNPAIRLPKSPWRFEQV